MHALSTTLNTKSMLNQTPLCTSWLNYILHVEPDKTISHIIGLMTLHHKVVTVSRFRMQQIP